MDSDHSTIRSFLNRSEFFLLQHGVPNARRNAEWILAQTLGYSMIELYTRSESRPSLDQARVYWERIEKRADRQPLQYILGTTEFMSLPFEIPRGVFIPRPDTELLVEAAEELLRSLRPGRAKRIMDLCCGSGVIAVSLARRVTGLEAVAVDYSSIAVQATRKNAELNGVADRVSCKQSGAAEYLAALKEIAAGPVGFSAILCNPPYIESGAIAELPREVRDHEPVGALDGGADGLDSYRDIIPRLRPWLIRGGFVAFEIGDGQARAVLDLLQREDFEPHGVLKDYAGYDRVVIGIAGAGS